MTTYHNICLRFPTRFDNGDDTIKGTIVTFAADKLLCRSSVRGGTLEPEESLACLAVRLGVDFRVTSWLDRRAEHNQVERHMRICLAATHGFRSMVTISPSEPLLAEASRKIMRDRLGVKEAPQALLTHVIGSYLSLGDRGEIVAALLLLLARDHATRDREDGGTSNADGELTQGESLKHDGFTTGRIVKVVDFVEALVPSHRQTFVQQLRPCVPEGPLSPTNFADAFANAYIYFNHFIKVYDFKVISRNYLWRMICRGAAIIFTNNQEAIDIIIPMLMGTILRPQFVSAILIQIKNNIAFTHNVDVRLFDAMDPFQVRLFSGNDAHVPPILRIVLALAAEKSVVAAPTPPSCTSSQNSKESLTTYDLWIAGVSEESFGVIPDKSTHEVYMHLLDCARDKINAYGALARDRGDIEIRLNARRLMHPAASLEDQHFENYIDLENVPAAL
jgi:hypothetical protein